MSRAIEISMKENTPIKTDVKSVLLLIGAVAAGVWAWSSVKAEVASHTEQLQSIQHTVSADHDAIVMQGTLINQQGVILEKMDRKIDFLTGASRTRPPATPPSQ